MLIIIDSPLGWINSNTANYQNTLNFSALDNTHQMLKANKECRDYAMVIWDQDKPKYEELNCAEATCKPNQADQMLFRIEVMLAKDENMEYVMFSFC